jgi:hypothetical protein
MRISNNALVSDFPRLQPYTQAARINWPWAHYYLNAVFHIRSNRETHACGWGKLQRYWTLLARTRGGPFRS